MTFFIITLTLTMNISHHKVCFTKSLHHNTHFQLSITFIADSFLNGGTDESQSVVCRLSTCFSCRNHSTHIFTLRRGVLNYYPFRIYVVGKMCIIGGQLPRHQPLRTITANVFMQASSSVTLTRITRQTGSSCYLINLKRTTELTSRIAGLEPLL